MKIVIIMRCFFSFYILFFMFCIIRFSSSLRFLYCSQPYCHFFLSLHQKDFDIFHEHFFVVSLCYLDIQLINFQHFYISNKSAINNLIVKLIYQHSLKCCKNFILLNLNFIMIYIIHTITNQLKYFQTLVQESIIDPYFYFIFFNFFFHNIK